MHIGHKALQHNDVKFVTARHNRHSSKRAQNAMGKALKTKVRREGKKLCEERD